MPAQISGRSRSMAVTPPVPARSRAEPRAARRQPRSAAGRRARPAWPRVGIGTVAHQPQRGSRCRPRTRRSRRGRTVPARSRTLPAGMGRDRIRRAQQAVDHPGLAAVLGGDPAEGDGEEAQRRGQHAQAQEPAARRRAGRASAAQSETRPIAIISKPMPTMTRKVQNSTGAFGHWSRGNAFEPLELGVPGMAQDQAAELRGCRWRSGSSRPPCRAGRTDRAARRAAVLEMALHGGDLGRLVLQRVEAVEVAGDRLQRRHERRHPHRHREHALAGRRPNGPCSRCQAPTPPTTKAVVR